MSQFYRQTAAYYKNIESRRKSEPQFSLQTKMESQCQGQTTVQAGGATQVIYAYKSGSTVYSNYNVLQSKITGAAQITLGILLVLCNITLLASKYFDTSLAGHGIWGGVVFIVSGSFGVVASAHKSKCLAITYMILCICSAVLCTLLIAFSSIGVVNGVEFRSYCRYNDHPYSRRYCQYGADIPLAFHSLMLIFGVLEAISAIWGSTLCCKAAPCCSNKNQAATPVQFVAANGNQMIVIGSTPAVDPMKKAEEGEFEKSHSSENQKGIDYQRLLD